MASSAADPADMHACADPRLSRRFRFEVAGTQVGGVERGMVVGQQRGVAFGEPFRVVERETGAAGLVHRAQQPWARSS